DDPYFFDKLKIHAWTKSPLISGIEVGKGLLDLGEEGFWNTYHRRELLHLLRARWNDIPIGARDKIERRIIVGQKLPKGNRSGKVRKHRASISASILGWLRNNGCALSQKTVSRLPGLQAADPDWNAKWELSADQSLDGRTDFVAIKSDPSKIIDLPIPEIIEAADKHSAHPFMEFTEYRPFSGLVKEKPSRALAALAYEARRKHFPTKFWEMALSEWPEGLSSRLQWLLGER